MKLGAKISETLKGKLSLGARILRVGGLIKIYKKLFSVKEEEKLLKASQCYLSTTTGPLAGLLFISTHRIAFCSDKPLKVPSSNGDHLRIHYKVSFFLISRLSIGENPILVGEENETTFIRVWKPFPNIRILKP